MGTLRLGRCGTVAVGASPRGRRKVVASAGLARFEGFLANFTFGISVNVLIYPGGSLQRECVCDERG